MEKELFGLRDKDGKFAKIVPQKKKLPKTKEELIIFLKEMRLVKGIAIYNDVIDDFLTRYED